MKRKLLLLCVATLLALAATGQTPVRQKPPRGRWGAEVNQELLPFFFMGTISADGIYNYAVADWFIIGAGVGLLLSDMEYGTTSPSSTGVRLCGCGSKCPSGRYHLFFSRHRAGSPALRTELRRFSQTPGKYHHRCTLAIAER